MTKSNFIDLFHKALNAAAENADSKIGRKIPREFSIEFHGAGNSKNPKTFDEAADLLFINENEFYRIIDIAVIKINSTHSTAFVRPSDHEPSDFNSTWNQPPGWGPFKQLIAEEIRIDD